MKKKILGGVLLATSVLVSETVQASENQENNASYTDISLSQINENNTTVTTERLNDAKSEVQAFEQDLELIASEIITTNADITVAQQNVNSNLESVKDAENAIVSSNDLQRLQSESQLAESELQQTEEKILSLESQEPTSEAVNKQELETSEAQMLVLQKSMQHSLVTQLGVCQQPVINHQLLLF
ncbi:TPA: hypothetical protein ACGOWL_001875 [Streptococcus suis]